MDRLRAGDPALDLELDAVTPSLAEVLAAAESDDGAEIADIGRSGRRRLVAAAGLLGVAAAVIAGVVVWPGQHGGPPSTAYGVTNRGNGLVDVRLPWNQPYTAAALQAKLRAAGVPAVVLMESPYGKCHEPRQDGIPYDKIIIFPKNPGRDQAFTIRPSAMPPGSTLVIVLRIPGKGPGEEDNLGTTYVTDQKPVTCVPQSIFPDPSPTARPS
jgi:hypothetical protein